MSRYRMRNIFKAQRVRGYGVIPLSVCLLLLGAVTTAWGGGKTVGSEFKVNTHVPNAQRYAAVTMDDNGNYVVVWESDGQDGSNEGIYAQRYDTSGVAQGSEFQVNFTTASNQTRPAIAMDSDGDFVIAWESNLQDGSSEGIYAQRYNASGVAQGSEFLVNSTTSGRQRRPSVAMDDTGNFVIAWVSGGALDGSMDGVFAQRYDASGVAQGGEFQVNTFTTGNQGRPSVAMDSDGDFVIAWQSNGQVLDRDIFAQRYNATGVAQGGEFQVNTETSSDQQAVSVAMDGDGDFVIVWQSSLQDGSAEGIFAQRYDASGVIQGSEFQVNTETSSDQQEPSLAVSGDGDFVIAWQSNLQDGSDFGIYAQCYNASGVANGSEFLVNTYTAGSQSEAAVAIDADGDFLVVWQSDLQDTDNFGIYAQAYQYSVDISIPDVTAKYSTTIDVPIQIHSDVTGDGIVASEISVTYRKDIVLSAVTNLTTLSGTSIVNSMVYQGWSIEENVFAGTAVDTLTIAMSTALDTLSGSGDLIYLTLQVADVRTVNSTPLELASVLFNDGIPAAFSTDGSLTVTGTDLIITTAPDSIRPGESVSITLTDVDLDADVGVAEQVSVTAFSVTYGDSQYVALTETGVNTGVFTGSVTTEFSAVAGPSQDGIIGTIAGDDIGVLGLDVLTSIGTTLVVNATPVPVYGGVDGVVNVSYVVQALDGRNGVRDTVRVQVSDADLDTDVGVAEQVSATITNAISGESEAVTLTETGVNTGVFQIRVPTIAGASGINNDGELSLASWDTLNVSYVDSLTAQGGVSPVQDITRVVNLFGDVQSNDKVQAFDAARLLAISVGLISANTQTTLIGDVDGNNAIQAFDASNVLQYVVRLIDRFAVHTDFVADPKNHPFEKPVSLERVIALGQINAQPDGTYLVPVRLGERAGILSGTLTFGVDSGLEVVDVMAAGDYAGFMVAHNQTSDGVKVAFAGSQSEHSGPGDVLLLQIRSLGDMRLRLENVVLNGQSLTPGTNLEAIEAVTAQMPEFVTALHQNLPNPFNPDTTIRYSLARDGQISLMIYSVTGQLVRTLISEHQTAGSYHITWDGRDAFGRSVASGLYMMRMETTGFDQTRKMLLLK